MNSVEVIGYLREQIEEFRKIEIGLPAYNDQDKNSGEILAKYWAGGDKNYFLLLPAGAQVAIRGHLDVDEKFGTILIIEQLYCLNK